MNRLTLSFVLFLAIVLGPRLAVAADPWVVYDGGEGPGQGKHIVFVTGDDEYRSEESIPQLAKILAVRHGFRCTVLFAIDKNTGAIDPATMVNIPGVEALDSADLMVLCVDVRAPPVVQIGPVVLDVPL